MGSQLCPLLLTPGSNSFWKRAHRQVVTRVSQERRQLTVPVRELSRPRSQNHSFQSFHLNQTEITLPLNSPRPSFTFGKDAIRNSIDELRRPLRMSKRTASTLSIGAPSGFRRVDPPLHRVQSFRPLELSIYLPGRELPELPTFEAEFGDLSELLECPERALVKSRSETLLSRTSTSFSIPRKPLASRWQSMEDSRDSIDSRYAFPDNGSIISRPQSVYQHVLLPKSTQDFLDSLDRGLPQPPVLHIRSGSEPIYPVRRRASDQNMRLWTHLEERNNLERELEGECFAGVNSPSHRPNFESGRPLSAALTSHPTNLPAIKTRRQEGKRSLTASSLPNIYEQRSPSDTPPMPIPPMQYARPSLTLEPPTPANATRPKAYSLEIDLSPTDVAAIAQISHWNPAYLEDGDTDPLVQDVPESETKRDLHRPDTALTTATTTESEQYSNSEPQTPELIYPMSEATSPIDTPQLTSPWTTPGSISGPQHAVRRASSPPAYDDDGEDGDGEGNIPSRALSYDDRDEKARSRIEVLGIGITTGGIGEAF
ncbi:hypothetical protein MMC09_006027 [Bachmanniomyces sp. S44760]|nr:hypothetical protein [Bachmanniomyces sp. S44760]